MTAGEDQRRKGLRYREVLIFTAGLLFLLLLLSRLVKPAHGDVYNITEVRMKTAALALERPESMDVFFSGNSESYRAFSPLQLWSEQGIPSYNLGASALRLCDSCEILREACEHQSPRVVFLETDCVMAESGTHRDETDTLTNFAEDLLPVFHYHIFYKSWLPRSVKEKDLYWRDADVWKGFLVEAMERPYTGGDYMAEEKRFTPIPESSLVYLGKIRDFCRDEGISLILVSAPSATNWHSGKHAAVEEWCQENEVPYLDLNLDPGSLWEEAAAAEDLKTSVQGKADLRINWLTDTMDNGNHVNLAGSRKVTAYMGEYLQETCGLPDHRGEPAYADWDEKLKIAELYP